MALKGKFGSISTRKANLDYIYPRVQAKLIELVQEDFKNKKIKDIVKEVKLGKHGDDAYRKEILGELYDIVQNKVNESMGNNKRYELNERSVEILAQRTINGEFGNVEQQKKEFGDNYEKIQKKICEINGINKNLTVEELAIKVIKGELGNGEERKKNLVTYIP